ncbi:helix-turn-helix transcriptional regulator [Clostridium estertheticum]|uniref:helix-turn-helix transcriptional regulator n=1 Tax=Clostridium estertheticum TaxID=238834 RepID=UPI001CF16E5A|nr:AraC family transcriptional regulator [Clostridium estertheticum]MCB2340511.1 AraC family transcriptional regulator [Clostridium estertheticum]
MTNIYFIGCDAVHPDSFVFDIPEGHDCWLLVHTKTPALFLVNSEIKEYPAHSAVLFRPHQKIYYRACADKYINDWIRFDSTESYITATTLPFGVPFSLDDPEYCHQLFHLLSIENFSNKNYKESSIDYLLRTLFNKLLESYDSDNVSPLYYELLNLRVKIHNNPGNHWTVPIMADYLHISPGYLQTIYKNTFYISCMDDVIGSRIHMSKEYLIHGANSIAEISTFCGYNNVEHFCRQFKQLTGNTPGTFRMKAVHSSTPLVASNNEH